MIPVCKDQGDSFVAFKACANGKYVSAEGDGDRALIASAEEVGDGETFEIVPKNDEIVYLKLKKTGIYVCAETEGTACLIANEPNARLWEEFRIIDV